MTSRRRNLFVILLVLGLLAASLVLIATKQTRLGLDLKGGVELVYQGQPTPQTKVTPAGDRPLDRHHARPGRRPRCLGARDPAARQRPGLRRPAGRQERPARDRPGRYHRAALLLRLRAERHRQRQAADRGPVRGGQARLAAKAGRRRQQHDGRPALPLQALPTTSCWPARTPPARPALRAQRPRAAWLRDRAGAGGHRRAAGREAGQLPGQQAVRPVVRAARQPRAERQGAQGPQAGVRPDDERADRHLQVHGQGAQGLPRRDAAARPARPDQPDSRPAGGVLVPDLRRRARPRGRHAALHQLQREPRRHRRPHRRPDLRRLHGSAACSAHRTWPSSSRSARCRSSSS